METNKNKKEAIKNNFVFKDGILSIKDMKIMLCLRLNFN